jgi:hypothetical protein
MLLAHDAAMLALEDVQMQVVARARCADGEIGVLTKPKLQTVLCSNGHL